MMDEITRCLSKSKVRRFNSGQSAETEKCLAKNKNQWLVLVVIAALAAFVIACGTDETKLVSNDGSGGVGTQLSQDHT
jgi:hypothetical protein